MNTDKIFSEKQFFLFATKFIRISRKSLESQVFFKKSERLTRRFFTVLLSHNNSFASEADIVIGDVHLALFALRST